MIPRRRFLAGAGGAALAGSLGLPRLAAATGGALPARATPLPLADVRLAPSPFRTAVDANLRYLLSLEPDRLLHHFLKGAGLEPRAPAYGGWESDTIAGHTLGHYLSALALIHAQTGEDEPRARTVHIVAELARAQAKRGDGYVGALQRKRKDKSIVDGQEIFTEIMRGEINSGGFDLNGSWSPLYTVHKLFAGLLDAHQLCGNTQALDVAVQLGGYFEKVFAALDDSNLQKVLACEYGGLNESFAELHARTKEPRWLALAERIHDDKVLDPLARREDQLANIHSNTQVPKLVGLARLHELTGKPEPATAARFFFERVTQHHSYVIGGNSDREYFFAPDSISKHVTEQTCEHCNSYNMLRLARHLFSWRPDGAVFDYYERTHFNHILSQQNPATGMFTYMTPLMSGAAREFSTPTESFWCCVGSGIESHAKHGESIFWEGADTLFVNLYIPASATWRTRRAQLGLATSWPLAGDSTLTFEALPKPARFSVALRIPAWATSAAVTVNGKSVTPRRESGYAIVTRRWRAGDTVGLTLPVSLRVEPTTDDPDTVAILRGPLVLAADLGAGASDLTMLPPALVGADVLAGFEEIAGTPGAYGVAAGAARPDALRIAPFYGLYERRTAVYFRRFTEAGWTAQQATYVAEQTRQRDIAARSVDVMHLGEMQPERDHNLASELSYPVSYRGLNGRDARSGGYFEFDLKVKPGVVLQATYWGDERRREFDLSIDGQTVARQTLDQDKPGEFFDVVYAIPEPLVRGKSTVRVRFAPLPKNTAGPVFGVRVFTDKVAAKE
ncbi:MAG TPA: glycoside hydrolase family 127 protein [Steroidobacteraceae bacterium]|nr:glycoside hydrolase family 127 protein [Steroidobacteraceae bacterium]